MDRIPVCGRCLKTGCFCELTNCDNKDGGPNFILLKTEDELREIGKEKIICNIRRHNTTISPDWLKIRSVECKGYDICFKEVK